MIRNEREADVDTIISHGRSFALVQTLGDFSIVTLPPSSPGEYTQCTSESSWPLLILVRKSSWSGEPIYCNQTLPYEFKNKVSRLAHSFSRNVGNKPQHG